MRIRKYISFLSYLFIICLLFLGCSSEYEEVNYPESSKVKYEITFSFSYKADWSIKNTGKDSNNLDFFVEDYLKSGVARHKVFIYEATNVSSGTEPVASLEIENSLTGESYDFSLPINLPEGDYVIKAWTDFKPSIDSDPYFSLTNFPQIQLERHSGFTAYQDSFSGSKSFKVDGASSKVEISMIRPSGRYIIINDNFREVLEESATQIDDISIIISYSGFYPDTYSVITDRLTDSITGEYYQVKPLILSNGSAIVAVDFMLMNSGGSSVTLQLQVVNKKSEVVASSEYIAIPMNRNEIIIINGNYLYYPSKDEGFGMDTDFDGDIIITT